MLPINQSFLKVDNIEEFRKKAEIAQSFNKWGLTATLFGEAVQAGLCPQVTETFSQYSTRYVTTKSIKNCPMERVFRELRQEVWGW